MAEVKTAPSPCINCDAVANSADCTKKTCPQWRAWYMEQWDYWAPLVLQKLKEKEAKNGSEA